jgi:hypothetical protein
MKKVGRVLSLIIGLSVAVALIGHFNSGTTRAVDIDHVKVVNSASDAVPVTGSVKASQNGSWKVGIDGTPTVNVASAPPVNVTFPNSIGINGTVPVQNAPSPFGPTPFIVQDFENPARLAFQGGCQIIGPGIGQCNIAQVPSNRHLAIEFVSLTLSTSAAIPSTITINTTAGNLIGSHSMAPVLIGQSQGLSIYMASIPVKLYADPGTTVSGFVETAGSNTTISANWTVSGHFVCTNYQTVC